MRTLDTSIALLLVCAFSLSGALLSVLSCAEKGDDLRTTVDNVPDEEQVGDDDEGGLDDCESVYNAMTWCNIALQDADGNSLPVEDVIAACEDTIPNKYALDEAIAACIIDNMTDCDAMLACLANLSW